MSSVTCVQKEGYEALIMFLREVFHFIYCIHIISGREQQACFASIVIY